MSALITLSYLVTHLHPIIPMIDHYEKAVQYNEINIVPCHP